MTPPLCLLPLLSPLFLSSLIPLLPCLPPPQTIRNGYHVSKHHIAEGTSPSLGITLVLGLLQNSVASLLVGLLVSLAIARVLKGLSASRAAMGDAEASVHDVIVIITGSYLSYVIATG